MRYNHYLICVLKVAVLWSPTFRRRQGRRDGREINIMPIKIFGDYQFFTIAFSQNNTIWARLFRIYRVTKSITSELSKVNIHFEL